MVTVHRQAAVKPLSLRVNFAPISPRVGSLGCLAGVTDLRFGLTDRRRRLDIEDDRAVDVNQIGCSNRRNVGCVGCRSSEWPLSALLRRWLIRPEGPESTHCGNSTSTLPFSNLGAGHPHPASRRERGKRRHLHPAAPVKRLPRGGVGVYHRPNAQPHGGPNVVDAQVGPEHPRAEEWHDKWGGIFTA
jgi:hypothetical protein